jgi:hypothetical protein
VRVTAAFQDEPVEDRGDGRFSPDAVIDGNAVLLRAERSGRGDGPVYHLEVTSGRGACEVASVVTVCVPHDQRRRRRRSDCGDQGPLFDPTAS